MDSQASSLTAPALLPGSMTMPPGPPIIVATRGTTSITPAYTPVQSPIAGKRVLSGTVNTGTVSSIVGYDGTMSQASTIQELERRLARSIAELADRESLIADLTRKNAELAAAAK